MIHHPRVAVKILIVLLHFPAANDMCLYTTLMSRMIPSLLWAQWALSAVQVGSCMCITGTGPSWHLIILSSIVSSQVFPRQGIDYTRRVPQKGFSKVCVWRILRGKPQGIVLRWSFWRLTEGCQHDEAEQRLEKFVAHVIPAIGC